MSYEERNLFDICKKIIDKIPNRDKNKRFVTQKINSILKTYIYAAPEVKLQFWIKIQELLNSLYPYEHELFPIISKIWNNK